MGGDDVPFEFREICVGSVSMSKKLYIYIWCHHLTFGSNVFCLCAFFEIIDLIGLGNLVRAVF